MMDNLIDYYGLHLTAVEPFADGTPCYTAASGTSPHGVALAMRHIPPETRVLVASTDLGATLALLAQHLGVTRVVGYQSDPEVGRHVCRSVRVNGRPLAVQRPLDGPRPLGDALRADGCHALVLDLEGEEFEALNTVPRGWLVCLVCSLHHHGPAARAAALTRFGGTCARLGLRIREEAAGEGVDVLAATPG